MSDSDRVFAAAVCPTRMQIEYEKLASRIENADEESLVRHGDGEFAELVGADRRDHPTIIKVVGSLRRI